MENSTIYIDAAKDLLKSSAIKIKEVSIQNYEKIKSPEFQENAKTTLSNAFTKTKELTLSTYTDIKNSEATKKIGEKLSEIKNSETSKKITEKFSEIKNSETSKNITNKISETAENIKENENFKSAYNSIISSGRKIMDFSRIMIYGEQDQDSEDNLRKEDDPFEEKNGEEKNEGEKDGGEKDGEGERELQKSEVLRNEVFLGDDEEEEFGKDFTI